LKEAWRVHARGTAAEEQQAIAQALKEVALPGDAQFLKRYPSQLSVGQAQRVLIAMATIHRPSLLIADEPTSALDLLTQADILELFRDLSRRLGTGILFISHDLLSVAKIAHRLAVMRDGQIVECGATATVFCNPSRAYTRQLVNALPVKPEFKANAAGAS
jgi:ABC-type dipeptide/oligopeptide/nickel transport system ATPase component